MSDFPFRIVGFDLDGTLIDTAEDLGTAVNHALSLVDRPPVPTAEVRGLIGGGARRMLEKALSLTGGGLPQDQVSDLHRQLIAFYTASIAVHSRLYPGGEAMLAGLAERGVKVAVVTNKLEALAVRLLGELDLLGRFATVIGGDTMGPGRAKPQPDQLHEMISRLGGAETDTMRAAYVGDTTYDTLAAKAAGLPCVAVSFGFNDLPPADLGADAVIDHFDALIPTLERL